MEFQSNTWYIAALSTEVGRELKSRRIAGRPILMYRREDGAVAAVSNLCPHRFAPLDRGKLVADTVVCAYHGLEFGPDGRCTANPHSARISPTMHIRAYPAVERFGMVWVWPGEAPADEALIPDMTEFQDQPGAQTVCSYLYADYRYDILIDNLMDLSHADYLHLGSFSAGAAQKTDLKVSQAGNDVVVERTQWRTPRPAFAPGPGDTIDLRTVIHWHPGQVITFRMNMAAAGEPLDIDHTIRFFHTATPADDSHTHYFMGIMRMGPPDPDADEQFRKAQLNVIDSEDGPMLSAIDDVMEHRDLMDMQPVILPIDAGGILVRRTMRRLVAAEAAQMAIAHSLHRELHSVVPA